MRVFVNRKGINMAAEKKKNEEKRSIEQLFEELEAITGQLDEDELPLEEAFQKYQKGMELLKECNEIVDKVEKELQILEES